MHSVLVFKQDHDTILRVAKVQVFSYSTCVLYTLQCFSWPAHRLCPLPPHQWSASDSEWSSPALRCSHPEKKRRKSKTKSQPYFK